MSYDQATEGLVSGRLAGARQNRNGQDTIPGNSDIAFTQQVVAMDMLAKRIYGCTHRLSQALDVAIGMSDAPSPAYKNTVESTPSNVPVAWNQLCQAVDSLEHEISRAYKG